MTQLRERPEIREVPKLERPRRPWFGWIVSLLVLVVAGGLLLITLGTGDTGSDGSYEFNEQARFERLAPEAAEFTPDGFDQAELLRFMQLNPEG